MAKLDKSLYTKEEWRAMQAQRNYDKSVHRAMKSGLPIPPMEGLQLMAPKFSILWVMRRVSHPMRAAASAASVPA